MADALRFAFVWENFGPMHHDRCEAVLAHFGEDCQVWGIELASKSGTYVWDEADRTKYDRVTLFQGRSLAEVPLASRYLKTLSACIKSRARHIFLCHYESAATLLVAVTLRVLGRRVYVMNDSKHDDYDRYLWRELLKSVFYLPYCGGLASGIRSKDYLRYLGIPARNIEGVYNAMSLARIRADAALIDSSTKFGDRYFIIVARLVPKKNLHTAIAAYALYKEQVSRARPLKICGSGPLREALETQVRSLGLEQNVHFEGHLSSVEVAQCLRDSLALLLPSIEEQFGNVVVEAQALNIPVILSDNCGARDDVVRTGVNGFVVEPSNAEGMAFFMTLLHSDEALWTRMSAAAQNFALMGDVARFSEAVEHLVGVPIDDG